MAVALTPLSRMPIYRNWRSLPPPIRSMEAPVPRQLCPPPSTTQPGQNARITHNLLLIVLGKKKCSHKIIQVSGNRLFLCQKKHEDELYNFILSDIQTFSDTYFCIN